MPTTAIIAGAMAGSAAASAASAENVAKKAECQAVVNGYKHDPANPAAAQTYAGCVDLLYPNPDTPEEIHAEKAAIVLLLVFAAVGAVRGRKDYYTGPWMGAMLGVMAGVAAILVLGAIAFVVGA